MKKIFLVIALGIFVFTSCRKAQITETRSIGEPCPWTDSSNLHPKNSALNALLVKYKSKGLPGISLLVNDAHGTWIGAIGKADLSNHIDFVPGTISQVSPNYLSALLFSS
ncbi:MAG: hypothetical protein E6H06_17630 [Bacteroidetes bacterium]|nr:MAG: hypothetical protein E6H06_17630 [Bacteroidota bacterium]